MVDTHAPDERVRRPARRAGDGAVRHNLAMSTTTVNELVAICAATFGLALYAGLILVPAWTAYTRLWQRLAATLLTLYVLVVLIGIGAGAAGAAIYFWS